MGLVLSFLHMLCKILLRRKEQCGYESATALQGAVSIAADSSICNLPPIRATGKRKTTRYAPESDKKYGPAQEDETVSIAFLLRNSAAHSFIVGHGKLTAKEIAARKAEEDITQTNHRCTSLFLFFSV